MKKFLVSLLLSVCMASTYGQQNDVVVEADMDTEADFSKFKTFGWASHIDNQLDQGGVYFLDDLILKAQIRDAVRHELMSLGYTFNPQQPDLLVNFRVFDKAVRIKGIEEDYWGGVTISGIGTVGDTTSYEVDAGTLMISLVDRKKGKAIFQGFASGLIDNNQFIKDEAKISRAVAAVIEESALEPKDLSKKD